MTGRRKIGTKKNPLLRGLFVSEDHQLLGRHLLDGLFALFWLAGCVHHDRIPVFKIKTISGFATNPELPSCPAAEIRNVPSQSITERLALALTAINKKYTVP